MMHWHMSIYKKLMNSLYGRFGINPKSTITEICQQDRYNHLIIYSELIFAEMLNEMISTTLFPTGTIQGR